MTLTVGAGKSFESFDAMADALESSGAGIVAAAKKAEATKNAEVARLQTANVAATFEKGIILEDDSVFRELSGEPISKCNSNWAPEVAAKQGSQEEVVEDYDWERRKAELVYLTYGPQSPPQASEPPSTKITSVFKRLCWDAVKALGAVPLHLATPLSFSHRP